jgi:hypothetical protein
MGDEVTIGSKTVINWGIFATTKVGDGYIIQYPEQSDLPISRQIFLFRCLWYKP